MPGFGADTTTYVKYTKTAGASWNDLARPTGDDYFWVDFAADTGGKLWGLALDSHTAHAGSYCSTRLYYSNDQGDTWTQIQEWLNTAGTSNIYRMCHIVCHPTNQNIMAILGWGKFNYSWRTLWSIDRGLTFGQNDSNRASDSYPDMGWRVEPVMLASGRIVWMSVHASGGIHMHVDISDDYGANWTDRFLLAGTQLVTGIAHDLLGSKLFIGDGDAGANPGRVYWSIDQGLNWVAMDNDVAYGTNNPLNGGLAYDQSTDSLFALHDANSGTNSQTVVKMSPVAQDGTWTDDITDTLLPIGGEVKFLRYAGIPGVAIAVIPA